MNELMLKSFLQLLACIVVHRKDDSVKIIRKYLENYIERSFGKRLVKPKLDEFNAFFAQYLETDVEGIILPKICKAINQQFTVKQKFLIIINIVNFFSSAHIGLLNSGDNTDKSNDNIFGLLAYLLNLNQNDFLSSMHFAYEQLHSVPQREGLLIAADKDPGISDIRFYKSEGLKGHLTFLYLKSADMLIFRYNGASKLEINGKPIFTKQSYIFQSGILISGNDIAPIYYGEILRTILHESSEESVNLYADNVSYIYPITDQGIRNVSLSTNSGELIGILGGSGVGKSTLIKILCGNLTPQQGYVLINGEDLHSQWEHFKGLIGVMHQEENLFEELTVFENLYYSAKLSLGNLPNDQLRKIVENKLFELELFDYMHNRVGPPDNRQLSGGQRKRLAIAMEIIREPKILFADEPTSGLSSADSDMVMRILKNIALGGKLVVVNIHQPSSEVFKLFDSVLVIDKGGVPVYSGNPLEAILHFKRVADRVDKDQSGCECCGSVKPEVIFDLMEERSVDELGQRSANRKFSPNDWYNFYFEKASESTPHRKHSPIPKAIYSSANITSQFYTFIKRNILTKIRNKEFMVFALALPPLLSIIISVFLRYSIPTSIGAEGYNIYTNPNVPSFFFMSILSSLFFGLIISCDDIIRDKRIIVREQYIGLNLKAFYNSKSLTLLLLSAIQTITFIIPGLLILEIKGMTLAFWLILMLVSILGNLLGLILSSTLKSVVAIYILVPFLIVPQILFSGLVVRFDNLNPRISTQNHVPLVGELMASRWAVEAMSVHFYQKNKFNEPLFNLNFRESELRFRLLYLIPEINQMLNKWAENPDEIERKDIEILESGFNLLTIGQALPSFQQFFNPWSQNSAEKLIYYLEDAKNSIAKSFTTIKHQRDIIIEEVYPNTSRGRELMIKTRNSNHNKAIEDLVRNKFYPVPLILEGSVFLQKSDPIYQVSSSSIGRSHFLAPYKHLGSVLIETYWYNALVLLLMLLIFYFAFIFNVFPRIAKAKFNRGKMSFSTKLNLTNE